MAARSKQAANPVLDDFRNFLYMVWKHLKLPPPTPVQYEIAEFLQFGPRRKIIEAFRGVGKSWITSAYVLWRLLKNPQLKFMVVSASKQRADDFSTFTLRLINEMPVLAGLRPSDEQRCSKAAFDVGPALPHHSASVRSFGVTGQMTGGRADEVIADDIEVPSNSATEDMREKLLQRVSEFESVLTPGGLITYLGTPQTEHSVYNKQRTRGYECRIWPAFYPTADKLYTYGSFLAQSIRAKVEADSQIAGQPTDPKRFDTAELMDRRAAMGNSQFTLQFMLDTSLSDAERYPLKLSDLVVMGLNAQKAPVTIQYGSGPGQQLKGLPNIGLDGDRLYAPLFTDEKWTDYEGSTMAIDPAGRGLDETAYAVVHYLHGNLFLTASGGLKGGSTKENLTALAEIAKAQKVNKIVIEANFGDGMFTQLYLPVQQRIYPCAVEEVKHSRQKELRIIDTLEPVLNQHRLIVDHDLVQADISGGIEDPVYSLLYQMTHLTKDRGSLKHDDRLDALAIAVNDWTDMMARDAVKAAKAHENRLLDMELRKFMKHSCASLFNREANRSRNKGWMSGFKRV